MERIVINSITIFFIALIITYTVLNLISNKFLYEFINEDYKKISSDYKRNELYNKVKSKYKLYIIENQNANINISSFIEEILSEFSYKEKAVIERIKKIKSSSSNVILLGVLGTFIGLSAMLFTINTKDIVNSLPSTIDSMQTGFITSIFGIISSIIINYYVENKSCEYSLTRLMLRIENLLTTEITHEKSQSIDSKIEDVKNTIKEISNSIKSIERFDQISKDLNEFNNQFISGVEALKELLYGSKDSIKIFDQDIRKLDKQFSIMNMKFKTLFDKYDELDTINKEILSGVIESSSNIKESTKIQNNIKEYIKNSISSFSLYERITQDFLNKLIFHENDMAEKNLDFINDNKKLDKSVEELSKAITTSSNDLSYKLNTIIDFIDEYKDFISKKEDIILSDEYEIDYSGEVNDR